MNLLDPPDALPDRAREGLRRLDTEHGVSMLWVVVWIVGAVAAAAFLAKGADGPDDPVLKRARHPVSGFGQEAFTIQPAEGLPSSDERCGLVADTPTAHRQGMMRRRDLAGHDAMLFRFSEDQQGAFWNRSVPIDLSLAWFDSKGAFVSATDMKACEDRDDCPLHHPPAPFRYALEVPRGGLSRLGVGPGTVLVIGGPCPGT